MRRMVRQLIGIIHEHNTTSQMHMPILLVKFVRNAPSGILQNLVNAEWSIRHHKRQGNTEGFPSVYIFICGFAISADSLRGLNIMDVKALTGLADTLLESWHSVMSQHRVSASVSSKVCFYIQYWCHWCNNIIIVTISTA